MKTIPIDFARALTPAAGLLVEFARRVYDW